LWAGSASFFDALGKMMEVGMATNWPKRKHLSAKELQRLASALRLNLDEHRARGLRPLIRQIRESYDALVRVELGDTAPATTFSAGWEE
jgi:hypothetical protein